MATPHAYPRKRLFVNREIQGRLLGRTALYWVLYHAVLWMAMFFYRYSEHRGAVLAGADPRSFNDLYGQFVQENHAMWFCAFAILPIVIWDLLKFSHRIVGPLVRFQRTLESLTAGETISNVQLRKGDLLFELQASFNQYLTSLRTMNPESEPSRGNSRGGDLNSENESIERQIQNEIQQLQAEIQSDCGSSTTRLSPPITQ